MRDEFSFRKKDTLELIDLLERNKKTHIITLIDEAFFNLQSIYLYWYNVLFLKDSLNEDIKSGRALDWLRNPNYNNDIKKGEFEKTEDYEKRIIDLKESDMALIPLLKEDLSLLFHNEIKSFISEGYERLIECIKIKKQLEVFSSDIIINNYDADRELLSLEIVIDRHPDKFRLNKMIRDYVNYFRFSCNKKKIKYEPSLENQYNLSIILPFYSIDTFKEYKEEYLINIPINVAEETVNNIKEGRYKLIISFNYIDIGGSFEFEHGSDIGDELYNRLINTDSLKYFRDEKKLPCIMPSCDTEKSTLIDLESGKSYSLV